MESVGSAVGKQMRNQGVLAVIYALLGILLYISFRCALLVAAEKVGVTEVATAAVTVVEKEGERAVAKAAATEAAATAAVASAAAAATAPTATAAGAEAARAAPTAASTAAPTAVTTAAAARRAALGRQRFRRPSSTGRP